jgi:abhydrolase domain-containing protein 1/3
MINCPDGGVVSLDWFEGSPTSADTPIAVLFPGLVGDSQSEYLRYIVPSLKQIGYRVVTFNNRGRGGLELRTPRIYCAANFDDVELAIDSLREKNPNSLIVASGFSMGGMVLTRYLAERGNQAKVDAAMLISANYDLVNGTKNMETGYFNRFVARVMTKELVNVLWADKEVLARTDKPVQWDKLRDATSFRELDRYFTCPMWGYNDPEDYFIDATNNDRLPKIQVPTLALNSADDMFSPYATLPLDKLNEAVVFVVTQRGGHLGFMDRYHTPFYGDRLIEQYHKAILDINRPRDLLKSL